MIIQKYVKSMPICFARYCVCAISIARIDLHMQYHEPKKLVFHGVSFKAVSEICAHLQAECTIEHARYSLIIMIIQKHVQRMLICFAKKEIEFVRFRSSAIFAVVRVCVELTVHVSYVQLINQCGLYVDKIKIFKKISGCGLYTGALNRPKITVTAISDPQMFALVYTDLNHV